MASVLFRRGDIFERGADLTVLPCSAKAHISKTAEAHVARFGLPLPSAKKTGEIEVKRFPGGGSVTRYIVWAASVMEYQSTPKIIRTIGERLGQLANEKDEIQVIESPLLGTGAAGLDALIAGPSLAKGFLATCKTDTTLIVYGQQATIIENLRRSFSASTQEIAASVGVTESNSISKKPTNHQYEFGRFRLLPQPRILLRDNNPVGLRPKTFELLLFFVQNQNRLISLPELAKELWPANQFIDKNLIYATISSLRKALDDRVSESRYLVSHKGGYRFAAEVTRTSEASRAASGVSSLPLAPTLDSCAVLPFTPLLRLNRPLNSQHLAFLKRFADTRRMKRDARKLRATPDPIRQSAGLPLGPQAAYFVGSAGRDLSSQDDPTVLDHNRPPRGQPSLWCDWFPTDDGQYIVWNQDEEFEGDVDWLNYIIAHFIAPWGYMLNGEIRWQEAGVFDAGTILVRNNRVKRLNPISVITESGLPRRLRVFLCHSSRDKPLARELYAKLRADGFDPWLDKENLLPGEDWEQEIRRAVRGTDLVIVCLSRNSVSKIGFIQKEIKYALDVADKQPEGTIFIIPLRLEVCDVPERLRSWQWVNLFEEDGYERLVMAFTARADFLNEYLEEA